MDADFWHERWALNQIGFHEDSPNPMLTEYVQQLELKSGDRVFVPLCGKTRDIDWLLEQGLKVIAVELSELAVIEIFEHLALSPTVIDIGKLKQYSATNIDVFVGDFFDLTDNLLGSVSAVYDRAALVALPRPMRNKYSQRLAEVTKSAAQLLVVFDYSQSQMVGPPFSIGHNEVIEHYGHVYQINSVGRREIPGGFRGMEPAFECVWHLHPLDRNGLSNSTF